ncbi:hypothetical protein [Streptomyces olivoreticuli]|uniref:hypothetical protein n=1 Tax=Streptomyces olivoreticuli TaxID=68246 RepID=UPI001F0864C8|nr:hypothetical protein [Streptomyces olivoreticuli]
MDDQHRTAFAVNQHGTAQWAPGLGELVTDPARDQVGKVIGWDGRKVTLRPLDGGDPWHTTTYRRATDNERLRARVTLLNRARRW